MTREEVIRRYRELREINIQQQKAALDLVPQTTLDRIFRRIGATRGRQIPTTYSQFNLASDFAVHEPGPGHAPSAIVRYARGARPIPGSDQELMLNAALAARFSVFRIDGLHDLAGLQVTDVVWGGQEWLIDLGMETSWSRGALLAGRLITPAGFSMTCGATVPLEPDLVMKAALIGRIDLDGTEPVMNVMAAQEFRQHLYRAAVLSGTMERVVYA